MVQKVPRNYFTPFLKIVWTLWPEMRIPNVWNLFMLKTSSSSSLQLFLYQINKLKYDDPNDDLPDRTTLADFNSAVKSLVQNSAPAIFYDFRTYGNC